MNTGEWCSKHGIAIVHYASVKLILDKLSDAELAAQYNCATAERRPDGAAGAEKVDALYQDSSTKMQRDQLEIFGREVAIRLTSELMV